MIDVLICSLPSGIINRPPAAPALLKSCVEQAGFSSRTEDLSLNFYINQCNKDFDTYSVNTKLFEPHNKFELNDKIRTWLEDVAVTVAEHQPKFVALSVFSTYQHRATTIVCQLLRKQFPDIKIILGGYGLVESVVETFNGFIDCANIKFDQYLKDHKLADYYVYGEGEYEIVNILNSRQLITGIVDLNQVPVSNFDDYLLGDYMWHTVPVLTITGSKGCVRNCTFCNVPRKFGKFRRRSGEHIAKELIHLNQKYNITKFEFTDSLVNGSQKDFQEWIEIIADYNDSLPAEQRISWYGQYICRPQAQVPKGIYETIKRSGALNLIIGAESGSNAVLEAMNKKITTQDIFDELEQFEKHGLQGQLLMLNGFYNETQERYLENLNFIVRCHRFTASGTITKIAVGFPLVIEPEGPLHLQAEELGIILNHDNVFDWRTVNDPDNTWLERLRRRVITQAVLNKMNVSMTINGIDELNQMKDQIKLYEQQLRSSNTTTDSRFAEFTSH